MRVLRTLPPILLLMGLLLSSMDGKAQSNLFGWGVAFINGPYVKKWGFYMDLQWRSNEDIKQLKSWLLRPAVQYQLNKRNVLTLGYAYVEGRVNGLGNYAITPEHRIWQQWIYQQPVRLLTLQHRLRLEERFIGSTRFVEGLGIISPAIFSTRIRYFNRLVMPWQSARPFQKGPYNALQNEVFFNLTGIDKLTGKVFDQNRGYISFGYRVSPKFDIELGYMRRDIRTVSNHTTQHIGHAAIYLRSK